MPEVVAECARCASPIERGDLRCAVCGDSAPHESERRTATEVEVLRCDGCGASVRYDPAIQAPRCGFCDSTLHVEMVTDPTEESELYFEFTVDPAQAIKAVRGWLGRRGFFYPSDLRDRARMRSVKPIYWAGWMFDADALVSYAADTNHDTWRSSWAPCAGQVELHFDDVVAPGTRGLRPDETAVLVSSYRGPASAELRLPTEDTLVERFEVQRSAAREIVRRSLRSMASRRIADGHLPGTAHRSLHTECVVRSLVTHRVSFPAYILAYRYRGELYRVVVSGQDASCMTGAAPLSWGKIAAVVAGVLALIALVFVIVAAM